MLIPTPAQHLTALTIAFAAGVLTTTLWRWHSRRMYDLGFKEQTDGEK